MAVTLSPSQRGYEMPIEKDTRSRGFTLVEVIIVFALISILATFLISHFGDVGAASLPPQAERLASQLRFAQINAMNTNETWGVSYVVSADISNYWLFKGTPANRKIFPGETEDKVDLGALDISIEEGSFTIYFDGWGRPTSPEIAFSSDRKLTLSLVKSGVSPVQLSIAQNTGFVIWP